MVAGNDPFRPLFIDKMLNKGLRCGNIFVKQEYIPVGYIPTAAVATTRCQYQVGSASIGGGSAWRGCAPVNRLTDTSETLPPRAIGIDRAKEIHAWFLGTQSASK